jgi:hypothetical protein
MKTQWYLSLRKKRINLANDRTLLINAARFKVSGQISASAVAAIQTLSDLASINMAAAQTAFSARIGHVGKVQWVAFDLLSSKVRSVLT